MIVIPIADEPANPSINFALATIARHCPSEPVALIGHLPRLDPVALDIIHIPTIQGPDQFANTDLAMRVACESDEVPDPFTWSADDIYWMRAAAPIRWALGQLDDATGPTRYVQRKHSTARLLEALGLPTWDYESHTPLLVHKAQMLEALALGGDKRSVYGNLTGQPDDIGPDVKLRRRIDEIADTPWTSTAGDPTRWPTLMTQLKEQR